MQSNIYILPHQHGSWSTKAKHLRSILQHNSLNDIFKELHEMSDRNNFTISTFGKCKSQVQILTILKFVAVCCLQVETLFKQDIPISFPINESEGRTYTVLTKRQCLCLVSNMFYSTTVQQPMKNLPVYYDFARLNRKPNQIIKVMMNYFERCIKMDSQTLQKQHIVYFRIAETPPFQSWLQCEEKLCQFNFHLKGAIEDLDDSIQIDFANKSIGGFFLSNTYTQQDIIFINSPELMPAVLFHIYMKPNQCILMVGAERYSKYTGYLETYQYAGNHEDKREIISLQLSENKFVKVKNTWISAIDAIPYFESSEFNQHNLNRELNKAYVGFNIMKIDGQRNKPISTGNWGSGAFMGNLGYKFFIQWLAVSRAKRKIDYFSFGDPKAEGIPEMVEKFKNLTVKELTQVLINNSELFAETKNIFRILKHASKKDVFENQEFDLKKIVQKKLGQ